MKTFKLALSIIIAIVVALFAMKLFFIAIKIAYSLVWALFGFGFFLIIALPVFFFVKKKLFK